MELSPGVIAGVVVGSVAAAALLALAACFAVRRWHRRAFWREAVPSRVRPAAPDACSPRSTLGMGCGRANSLGTESSASEAAPGTPAQVSRAPSLVQTEAALARRLASASAVEAARKGGHRGVDLGRAFDAPGAAADSPTAPASHPPMASGGLGGPPPPRAAEHEALVARSPPAHGLALPAVPRSAAGAAAAAACNRRMPDVAGQEAAALVGAALPGLSGGLGAAGHALAPNVSGPLPSCGLRSGAAMGASVERRAMCEWDEAGANAGPTAAAPPAATPPPTVQELAAGGGAEVTAEEEPAPKEEVAAALAYLAETQGHLQAALIALGNAAAGTGPLNCLATSLASLSGAASDAADPPAGTPFSRGAALAAARAALEAVDAPPTVSAAVGEGLMQLLGTRPARPTASLAAFLRPAGS